MNRLVGFLIALFCCSRLLCADEPCSERAICWQGVYGFGQLGAGWGHNHLRFVNPNYFNTLGSQLIGSDFKICPRGGAAGGGLGYALQRGAWVIGVEGSALGLNLKKRIASPFFPDIDRYTLHLEALLAAKMRVGYACGRWLPFAAIGWASGRLAVSLKDTFAQTIVARGRSWTPGWVVGAGCDYRLSECLSCGFAYDFISLRKQHAKMHCPDCGAGVGYGTPIIHSRIGLHLGTIRLAFHF